jgi:hypothetical protein
MRQQMLNDNGRVENNAQCVDEELKSMLVK